MNTIRLTALLLLCVGMTTCQADQMTFEASKDTTIFGESDDLSNGGGRHLFSGMTVGKQGTTFRRALLGFDLTAVPTDATITEVSLGMNVNKALGATAFDMSVHRLIKDFGEGASDASGQEGKGTQALAGDATWADAVLGEVSWDARGGDFISEASSVASVTTGNSTWNSTDRFVADVQLWVDNPDMNFGWILIGDEQTLGSAKRFDSRTGGNPPTLTVDFELGSLLGDCNGDGVLDAEDLSCIATIDERDAVLAALNTLPGDLDGNGDVAFADFLVVSTNFATDLSSYTDGNIDLDNGVAFADFLVLSTNFGKTPEGELANFGRTASLASVPEPSSIYLLILAVLSTVSRRRKPR